MCPAFFSDDTQKGYPFSVQMLKFNKNFFIREIKGYYILFNSVILCNRCPEKVLISEYTIFKTDKSDKACHWRPFLESSYKLNILKPNRNFQNFNPLNM